MIVNILAIIGAFMVALMGIVIFAAFVATWQDRKRAKDDIEYRGWMDEEKKNKK